MSTEYEGLKNIEADTLSRVPTTGETAEQSDLEIMALYIETRPNHDINEIHFMDYSSKDIIDDEDMANILLVDSGLDDPVV